jgi:hypothetical protein
VLPDPHILAAEIAEDLESALDQIRDILGDLEERVWGAILFGCQDQGFGVFARLARGFRVRSCCFVLAQWSRKEDWLAGSGFAASQLRRDK